MTRILWAGRSPLWRGAAIVSALLLAGTAWVLGSPLFIRTTLNEELPSARTLEPASSLTARPALQILPAPAVAIAAKGELQFIDDLHNGKGPVSIVRVGDRRLVRFENVSITNAPDVHVYLSRETGGKWSEATSLYLGPLKATDGSFNYDIPASADLALYKSVVVWCRAFSILVTYADLAQ